MISFAKRVIYGKQNMYSTHNTTHNTDRYLLRVNFGATLSHLREYTNIANLGLIYIDLSTITVNNVQRIDDIHICQLHCLYV